MIKVENILSTLKKAVYAEQKHGFTNTAVIGGFDSFLKKVFLEIKDQLSSENIEQWEKIIDNYSSISPVKRRQVFPQIIMLLKNIEDILVQTQSKKESSVQTSSATVSNSMPQNEKPHSSQSLKPTSLQYLKGVGPERVKLLKSIGLSTVYDLLVYYPRRYEDRRPQKVSDLKEGEVATVQGVVVASKMSPSRIKVIKLTIEDSEGRMIYGTWFNQTYVLRQYPVGTKVRVTGKVRWQGRIPEILATDIIKENQAEIYSNITPIYSEIKGLSSKVLQRLIQNVIKEVECYFPEILPVQDLKGLMSRPVAHKEIHFPVSFDSLSKARDRLVFEEILFLQIAVARLRQSRVKLDSPQLSGNKQLLKTFFSSLPFELTGAQKRVIREIYNDMAQPKGMARLVQGDVGSGKTVIAMAALLQAIGSGFQGAMMAPTEILAMQHYDSLRQTLEPLGIKVIALMGNQTKSEREQILSMVESGEAQIVVGTHALIQEGVSFKALGLAVTDEQHRFGVKQRTLLQSKGKSPHVLVLTATPIPRTLALTLYGDLQISVLDEMPPGRKPIITQKMTERSRSNLEKFMEEQIEKGCQIYIVCPLVEESEVLDLKSTTERAEQLKERFPQYEVALLHGKMKGTQKEEIMKAFVIGKIHILVSTTVIEVGVNVPNATVMIIEGADRFGLAQLHQLRGRVGRGQKQSFCILVSDSKDNRRLDVLCETEDGFKIAEEDLKIRGPGELLGTKQHGITELKLVDLTRDGRLIERAYQMTQKILDNQKKYDTLLNEVDKIYTPEKIGLN